MQGCLLNIITIHDNDRSIAEVVQHTSEDEEGNRKNQQCIVWFGFFDAAGVLVNYFLFFLIEIFLIFTFHFGIVRKRFRSLLRFRLRGRRVLLFLLLDLLLQSVCQYLIPLLLQFVFLVLHIRIQFLEISFGDFQGLEISFDNLSLNMPV